MNLPVLPATLPWLPHLQAQRPAEEALRVAARAAVEAPLTYPYRGASKGEVPIGWSSMDRQVTLGRGTACFHAATEALHQWRMFDIPWVELWTDGKPYLDQVVAFGSRQYGLWSVHVVRVVDLYSRHDEHGLVTGFAYGTLPRHGVRGEERFEVRLHNDHVHFRIRQFSLPSTRLGQVLGPVARRIQAAFVRDALAAMTRAVS